MLSQQAQKWLFRGSFVHCKSLGELESSHSAAICVDERGIIVAVEESCPDQAAEDKLFEKLQWSREDVSIRYAKKGQFFFPGFIDTHIHASQYPNAGIFGSTTLLDWLEKYTFPTESSLADIAKARTVYSRCIKRTLSHGTTTASYYATTSVPSTNLLADLCLSLGQRAFIGRVCMDSLAPKDYIDESPEVSISNTRATIEHIAGIDPDHRLVTPIITPRFAPSCSSSLLRCLGDLQRETDLPVQTHISENTDEVKLVAKQFPDHSSYTHVYDEHGLLGPKTILAHAIHLTDEEMGLIKKREGKISHCPASNSALTSGAAKVRVLLDKGIEVGLGTDMSGGYSPSILENVRQAILVSRHLGMNAKPNETSAEKTERGYARLSVEEALYLSTRGGAKVVGLGDTIGGFEVGKEWDAQLIGMCVVDEEQDLDLGPVDVFEGQEWQDIIHKWVFNGDDRNTLAVWVKGRLVHQR